MTFSHLLGFKHQSLEFKILVYSGKPKRIGEDSEKPNAI